MLKGANIMQISDIFALQNNANYWHVFPGGGWGDHIKKTTNQKADSNYWHAKRRKYYANN